jgi:ArsR family transcriptional regulator, arsenate/arsenite/antimonite-responsive transcriptional repressor
MALNKKDQFEDQEVFISEMAKSLSHPARVRILKLLAEKPSCNCAEVVEILPLAQSTVSQHLIELKKVGLVKGTINGSKSCFCINWENFEKLQRILQSYFAEINLITENDCC